MLKSKMLTAEPFERDEAPGEITGGGCDLIAQTLHALPAPLAALDDPASTASSPTSNGAWLLSSYVIWVNSPNARLPISRPVDP